MEKPLNEKVYTISLILVGDKGYELDFYDLSPSDEFWDCNFSFGSYYQSGSMLYMKDSVRGFEMEFEFASDSSLIARKAYANILNKLFYLSESFAHDASLGYPVAPDHDFILKSNSSHCQKKYVSFPPEGCYGLSSEEFAVKLYYINHRYEFVFHEVIISEGEWIIKNGEIVFKDAVLSGNFTGIFCDWGLEVNILPLKLFFKDSLFPDRNR
jgi:hypothetical protein